MSKKLDGKFYGLIYREKDNTLVPPSDYVIFLARDNAFLPTLKFYLEECKRQGAQKPQTDAVEKLIGRVEEWRKNNPDKCKTPDVDPGELGW